MASYKKAVQWCAENDEPTSFREEEIVDLISTLLVADIFDKTPEKVALDILNYRRQNKPGEFVKHLKSLDQAIQEERRHGYHDEFGVGK